MHTPIRSCDGIVRQVWSVRAWTATCGPGSAQETFHQVSRNWVRPTPVTHSFSVDMEILCREVGGKEESVSEEQSYATQNPRKTPPRSARSGRTSRSDANFV